MPDLPAHAAAPLHRIRLPDGVHVHSAAFSPDGDTLYLHASGQAINLWEVLVNYWPEVGGVLTALALAVLLLRIRRVLRTPRIVGEPHCRRCNYCLRGAPADRCPECGRPISRPIRGRSTRQRLLPLAIPCLSIPLFYAALWATWLPRSGPVSNWCNWWSFELESRAAKLGFNASTWVHRVRRILTIDTREGRIRNTLFVQKSTRSFFTRIAVSGDGRRLVLPLGDGDRLGLIDTSWGTLERSLQHRFSLHPTGSHWIQILGFHPDGQSLYATAFDDDRDRIEVLRCDLQTGASDAVISDGPDPLSPRGHTIAVHSRFQLFGGDAPGLVDYDGVVALILRPLDAPVRSAALTVGSISWSELGRIFSFSSDGVRVYVDHEGREPLDLQLVAYDTRTGARVGSLPPPPDLRVVRSSMETTPTTGRRALRAHRIGTEDADRGQSPPGFDPGACILVADLDRPRWTDRLAIPGNWIPHHLLVSPDARVLVAIGSQPPVAGTPVRFRPTEILLYRLDQREADP